MNTELYDYLTRQLLGNTNKLNEAAVYGLRTGDVIIIDSWGRLKLFSKEFDWVSSDTHQPVVRLFVEDANPRKVTATQEDAVTP